MQIAMIGLGRMGASMSRRLLRAGHEVVVFDLDSAAVEALVADGARGVSSVAELTSALERPRAAWIMVTAQATPIVISQLRAAFEPGDVIVEGGNNFYREAIDVAQELAGEGIHLLDVGVSGGIHGLDRGYCLMVGGESEAVARLAPVFDTLAPGVEAAPRLNKHAPLRPEEQGWAHLGGPGAGHFVKMVHNGIEYGMMAAYAEGLALLEAADEGTRPRANDAETAPLRDARYYQFELDPAAITELWRRGSVIGSWLLDLTADALVRDPELAGFSGHVSDSGEGRWTVQAAVDCGVPAHVLTAALYSRFDSRGNAVFGNKILSAMRKGFGGHDEVASTQLEPVPPQAQLQSAPSTLPEPS